MKTTALLLLSVLLLSCGKKEREATPADGSAVVKTSSTVVNIGSSDQFSSIISQNKLTVVDLYADWCGPCRMLAPIFTELSGEYGSQANFLKVNVDKHTNIAREYNARSIPLLVFIKDGKEVERVIGVQTKDKYAALIKKHM